MFSLVAGDVNEFGGFYAGNAEVRLDELKNAIKKFIWGQNRKLVLERLELIRERIDSMEALANVTQPAS